MSKYKIGRMTSADYKYIEENRLCKTPEEIAEHLNRSPASITKLLKVPEPTVVKEEIPEPADTIRAGLRDSSAWERLSDEFDKDELGYFEERYVALMKQFRDDVLATEENQIMKAIKYELLMSRNLIERKKLRKMIEHMEKFQSKFLSTFKSPHEMSETDKVDSVNIAQQLSGMRAAEQSKYNEYTSLDKQHQQLMKDLKATREQRVSRNIDGKMQFLDFIKMMQEEDVKNREGRQMAHMRKATERELSRLSAVHTYLDGTQDQPVLSADTVGAGD